MEDEVDMTGETTKEESSDIIEWEEEWISRLKESQKIYIEKAIQSLTEMDTKRREGAPKEITTLEIGTLVLSEQGSSFRRGPNSKLLPLLAGPLRSYRKTTISIR